MSGTYTYPSSFFSEDFLGLTGGTITGNTRVVGNFSADTYFSGSTSLSDIIYSSIPITRIYPLQIGVSEDLSHLLSDVLSVGLISDTTSLITDNGGETIKIAAGEGLIRVSNNPESIIWYVAWAETIFPISTNYIYYVYFSYNSGSPILQINVSEFADSQTNSYLGKIYNIAGVLDIHNDPIRAGDFGKRMTAQWKEGIDTFVKSGEVVTDPTSPSRKVGVEAGLIFERHIYSFTTPTVDTSSGDTATLIHRNGVNWFRISGQTEWNNTQIDTGTTLADMTTGFYACVYIIRSYNGFIYFQQGQNQYATDALARAETHPAQRPEEVTEHGYYVAKLVFQKGASTFSGEIVSLKPTIGGSGIASSGGGGGTSDHEELSGLLGGGAGDHYHLTLAQLNAALDVIAYGKYWTIILDSPIRTGNYTFTVADAGNGNLYNLLLSRKTVLKWTDTGVVKQAMVHNATYTANTVTITTIGDILTTAATISTMKYAGMKAEEKLFPVAGSLSIGNDISGRINISAPMKMFGADGYHTIAGTTNATTYQISKNSASGTGTTLASVLSIASGGLSTIGQTVIDSTTLTTGDYLALNCVSASVVPPIDTYVYVFMFPLYNQYLQ